MRLSVDFRHRSLSDVRSVLAQLLGESGSLTTSMGPAALRKFGVMEAAMEDAVKAAWVVLSARQ